MVDPFHQAAVAGDDEGAVIDQIVAVECVQMPLGDRHANRGGEALAQRTGGGLDPLEHEAFRMTRARAVELAEVPDVVDRRAGVASEVEQCVDQHRAVAGRQHKAVAVGPFGIGGVELEVTREQRRCGVGHAHRHSGVARIGFLDGIHGERPNGIGKAALGRLHVCSIWISRPSDFARPLARCLLSVRRLASTSRAACPSVSFGLARAT